MDGLTLGLLSDTHVPDRVPRLRPQVLSALHGVDLILHTGDISSPGVVEELERIAPVAAVRGNNFGDWRRFQPPLPRRKVVQAGGWRFGMHHGIDTLPQRLMDWVVGNLGGKAACARYIMRRVDRQFEPGEVDVLLFGHAHWPLIQPRNGVLYLNPGQSFGDRESSLMILDINGDRLRVRFVPLGIEGRLRRFRPREFVWLRADGEAE
jgi:putative phosphoesterase